MFIGAMISAVALAFTAGGLWCLAFVILLLSVVAGKGASEEKNIAYGCASLTTGFAASCATLPVGGLEVDVYLFNRDEIDLTTSTVSGRTISDIGMKGSSTGYKFSGLKTSNTSSIIMNPGKYSNNWIHQWAGVIFDNTASTKSDIVEKLASANIVAVVRNKWKGTDSNMEFEVLGWDVGLEMTAGEKKSDDADTQNAWKVTMSSPKDQFETNAGYIFFDTDQATTILALDAVVSGSI